VNELRHCLHSDSASPKHGIPESEGRVMLILFVMAWCC